MSQEVYKHYDKIRGGKEKEDLVEGGGGGRERVGLGVDGGSGEGEWGRGGEGREDTFSNSRPRLGAIGTENTPLLVTAVNIFLTVSMLSSFRNPFLAIAITIPGRRRKKQPISI